MSCLMLMLNNGDMTKKKVKAKQLTPNCIICRMHKEGQGVELMTDSKVDKAHKTTDAERNTAKNWWRVKEIRNDSRKLILDGCPSILKSLTCIPSELYPLRAVWKYIQIYIEYNILLKNYTEYIIYTNI